MCWSEAILSVHSYPLKTVGARSYAHESRAYGIVEGWRAACRRLAVGLNEWGCKQSKAPAGPVGGLTFCRAGVDAPAPGSGSPASPAARAALEAVLIFVPGLAGARQLRLGLLALLSGSGKPALPLRPAGPAHDPEATSEVSHSFRCDLVRLGAGRPPCGRRPPADSPERRPSWHTGTRYEFKAWSWRASRTNPRPGGV